MSRPGKPTFQTVTGQQLRELIAANVEPDEPLNTIMGLLREMDGKKLDKRNLAKLEAVVPNIRKRMVAGMTNLEWGGWGRDETPGGALLLAYDLGAVQIDCDWIIARNPSYFAGQTKRNKVRQQVLNDTQLLAEMSVAINQFQQAYEHLASYLERDEFDPDRYSIEQLAGLRDKNRRCADLTV